jgi:hypothetical protein
MLSIAVLHRQVPMKQTIPLLKRLKQPLIFPA